MKMEFAGGRGQAEMNSLEIKMEFVGLKEKKEKLKFSRFRERVFKMWYTLRLRYR